MAEDTGGDKTEAPTARRRQEAREQGNIARSPDLTAALLLISGLLSLHWFGQRVIAALRTVLAEMLSAQSLSDFSPNLIAQQALYCLSLVGLALVPVLGIICLVVICANLAQTGIYFNTTRLTPNFAALNPTRGLGRIFSMGQGGMHLLMNLLKVVLVGLVAYSAIGGRLGQIVSIQQFTFIQIFGLSCDLVYAIGIRVGVLLLVLALLDYVYQRYRNEQQLKMSKQEVKDEMRRMEGDPLIKRRRRQLAVQRHMQVLKKEVPKADVVVTNPTHVAVALKYEQDQMRAPRVIAKGADYMAQRIRELAIEAGVPIVERAPLARAIFNLVDVGEEIPEQFYAAVAEILAYVYELTGKIRRGAVPV